MKQIISQVCTKSCLIILLLFNSLHSKEELQVEKKPTQQNQNMKMNPHRDSKLEKQCKQFEALMKKQSQFKGEKHQEQFIEKLLEESFFKLQNTTQAIDLRISFEQLRCLLQDLKNKDLSIFFKGGAVRKRVITLFNLLERIKETGEFVKKIERKDVTRDSFAYIFPFLTHYLLLVAQASKLNSIFVDALARSREKAESLRATRLYNTTMALLLDLKHISFALNTFRASLKAFHGEITP